MTFALWPVFVAGGSWPNFDIVEQRRVINSRSMRSESAPQAAEAAPGGLVKNSVQARGHAAITVVRSRPRAFVATVSASPLR